MSKLMFIFGILFLAAGVALGLLIHFSPGEMQVQGLTPDVSAILLVGGALCLGLGSTIGALRDRAVQLRRLWRKSEPRRQLKNPPRQNSPALAKKLPPPPWPLKQAPPLPKRPLLPKPALPIRFPPLNRRSPILPWHWALSRRRPSGEPVAAKAEPEAKPERRG